MTRLFDQCGWPGPGFMELSRRVREISPLIHTQGLYLRDGAITADLVEEDAQFLTEFRSAQYYRENEVEPVG